MKLDEVALAHADEEPWHLAAERPEQIVHAVSHAFDDFPNFKLDTICTPCTHNPLGTKGCGEAGAIGSPPAVINAVLDALRDLGVKEFDMPASPARVWEAIRAAKA